MSSWFSSFDANDALSKLTEISSNLKETVQTELQNVTEATTTQKDGEGDTNTTKKSSVGSLLQNLSLMSPEMIAQRQEFEAMERRKELVKNHLTDVLPWETKNEELEILVSDVQQEILKLSQDKRYFLRPFYKPDLKLFHDDGDNGGGEDGNTVDEEFEKECEEKLQKIQPLPVLLSGTSSHQDAVNGESSSDNDNEENVCEFDLDAHVGLIERLLSIDPQLKERHSQLIGAGDKERLFWRNYFFHCAYTRYEKGLSIEEIWERKPVPLSAQQLADQQQQQSSQSSSKEGGDVLKTSSRHSTKSVEVEFVPNSSNSASNPEIKFSKGGGGGGGTTDLSQSSSSTNKTKRSSSSYEIINDTLDVQSINTTTNENSGGSNNNVIEELSASLHQDIDGIVSGGDGEEDLDDLEAEIARELEDD